MVMSRLIDADKLIEDVLNSMPTGSARGVFRAFIEEQPIAYDVEKVVKELKRKSKIHEIVGNSKNDLANIYASACYDEAIEIVKEGWIDETI